MHIFLRKSPSPVIFFLIKSVSPVTFFLLKSFCPVIFFSRKSVCPVIFSIRKTLSPPPIRMPRVWANKFCTLPKIQLLDRVFYNDTFFQTSSVAKALLFSSKLSSQWQHCAVFPWQLGDLVLHGDDSEFGERLEQIQGCQSRPQQYLIVV